MPIAFLALAWLAIMTGIRGDYTQVGAAFSQDVIGANGQGGFVQFGGGLIGIAVFFRLIGAPNAGRVFIGLVVLVFLIQNPNILTALQSIGSASTTTGTVGTTNAATLSGAAAQAAPTPLGIGALGTPQTATSAAGAAVLGTTGETGGSGTST